MKQLYTKYFIMLMMLCAFISVTNGQIQSLPGGGDWNSIYTWIGGTIPGINDDVIIDGIVECDNGHHCNNLTVLPTGVLRNNYYSGSLTVNGNITNHGGIENYVSNMTLYLKGNVNNNGVWTNSYVRINGTGNQTVTCSNGHTFGGYQFVMEKPSGDFTFDGEVNFDNCQVLLADYTVYLTPGSTINIHDAVFNNCTVMGGGSSSVINGIGTYNADAPEFNYVHFHDLTFTGEINIYNGCSTHGTVYNNAMMQNSYYGAVLSVYDNFINNGTLRNYVSNFTLNVYDHFFNNNVVDNHALDFRGDDDQEVSLAPGKTYSPSYFTSFKATGKIVALTDLRFENVLVNMGSDTLLVPAGGLIHMDDGEFKSGVVAATEPTDFGDLTFHSENGATTNNSTFYNATLTGHFLCSYNNIFRGVTNNNGLMENDYYGLDADIYDHFINNGTIQNYVGNLILNLYGNFVNNGVVENHALDFYGTTDQLVDLLPGEAYSPTYFTSFKPSGKIVASADLVFQQTIIDLNNDTLMLQDDGTLALDGGYINEAVILDENNNTGYLHINFINEAYMSNCTIHNPELLGTVDLNTNNTFIGEVLVTGTARNDYNGYTLTINGNIINNGIIQNYINSLTVNINGHVTNNGIWENSYTHLNGTADQHVTCQNSNWFTGYQFFNSNSSGIVYFDDMVGFHNCQVRIEGNTINLPINSTLYMHGSYLTDCNLIGYNETSVIHGEGTYYVDGPYMQNSTFENISLTGDWGIGTGITFNGSVINNGILQNAYFSYALVVNAVFVNNGTIKSFINNLSMYMYSNFTNNGDWSGYTIDLNSSADQKITLADGKVFNPGYFHSYKPSGKIVALTDLSFVNTYIDINNDTLVLPEGATLSLNNRFLQEAVVNAESGRFNLYMTNEAYLQDCQLFDADLYGTIDLKDNEFFGTTINRGTMRNDYFSYTTDFYGDLINHGTIQNYINSFIIRAHANITNNGIWSNYYTLMEGTSDQYIHLNNGHWIDGQMRIHADISGPWYQWYWNGGAIVSHWPDPDPFSGYTSNTLQFNNPVSANRLGTYNCNVGGVYSRDIIVDQSSTMRLDVKVFMEGPFNGTEMNNTINPLIPLQNSLGIIGYSGPEAVSSIPNADIVDWVGFELRDAPDAASANENTTVGGGAYFLLKDGSIVGLDGNSMPSFDITISNQLFVLVWHRNHLPVMSKYPLTESGGIYSYDFTTAAGQAYGDNQSDLSGGFFGMIGGNANGDGIINENDGSEYWYQEVGQNGYLQSDANLDTQVDNRDKNDVWFPNRGKSEFLPQTGFNNCGDVLIDDRDGKAYNTIQIGDQCWMAQNLNVGNIIPVDTDQTDNPEIEKYCYDDSEANCDTFGGLYQWNEMMAYNSTPGSTGICPDGWHVPTTGEWNTLLGTVDTQYDATSGEWQGEGWQGYDAGAHLKEAGLNHWDEPNLNATNSSGFTDLPSGGRILNATYYAIGLESSIWTSNKTTPGSNDAWRRGCKFNTMEVSLYYANLNYGFSVRCVKD